MGGVNLITFIIVIAMATSSVSKGTVEPKKDITRPAPWYDCSDKEPGNYRHPTDYTRFIICDAGLRAIEFDCASCLHKPEICTEQGRLVYDVEKDMCLGTDEVVVQFG